MLGFYAGTGVIVALLAAGYFAWTPLRIWYHAREVRNATCLTPGVWTSLPQTTPKREAAKRLAAIGPAAYPAFERLMKESDAPGNVAILNALGESKCAWAVPLMIESVEHPDVDRIVKVAALHNAELASGEAILPPCKVNSKSELFGQACRLSLLDWWEREGKAKYGRGAPAAD